MGISCVIVQGLINRPWIGNNELAEASVKHRAGIPGESFAGCVLLALLQQELVGWSVVNATGKPILRASRVAGARRLCKILRRAVWKIFEP
jgi:hypothetical protein